MNRRRPAAVLTMAILNIVFGTVGLLCSLCGMGTFALLLSATPVTGPGGNSFPANALVAFIEREVPGYRAVELGKLGAVFVLSLLLIVAAIGLFKMQSWARWASVGCGIGMVLLQSAYLFFEFRWVVPATERWNQLHGVAAASQAQMAGTKVGIAAAALLFIGYGLVLVLMMLVPPVSTAFAETAARRQPKSPGDWDEDDGPRRPRARRNFDEEMPGS